MPPNPANPPNGKNNPNRSGTAGAVPSAYDRLLPEAREAERALLGSMLLDKAAIGEAITVLKDAGRNAFAREAHQHLYDVLVQFYVQDQPLDGVVIKDELARRGLWESIGGFELLGGLVSAVPSALRVRHYAEIVYEKHLLRQLIGALHRAMEVAFDGDRSAKEALDYAEKEVFGVTEQRITGEAQFLGDLLMEAAKIFERRGDEGLSGAPTGFLELDELTCGLQPTELIIVAGRPSMGKTAFGLNVAENLAIGEHRPVLFFSLEMSKQQVVQRILCSRARVDSHRLRRGRISDGELERLKDVANDLSAAPLLVDDTSDLTILELRARARMAQRKLNERNQRLHAIFVDYLQLMHVPRSENRQNEVATISRGLKALAKDLKVPVVAMAQLNRNPEDQKMRRGNRPRMSDLRESGAIEQDADVVMLLHREAYYKPDDEAGDDANTADIIIAKQRNGPTGDVKLHFNRQWTRFDNHRPGGQPDYVPKYDPAAPF